MKKTPVHRISSFVLPAAILGFAALSLPAQTRDHAGLVHLGSGKWGTPDEARAAGLFEYRGRWLPKKLERQLQAWEKLDAKSTTGATAYDTRSKHYRLKTDVPHFIVELEIKPFLDQLFAAYTKVFGEDFGLDAKAADKKFINIYSGYREYREQTGKTRGTPGFIVGSNDLHVFYEDVDPAQFYGTTFHEGAHQFFAAMLPGAALPHWLNEALATCLEGCSYSRSTGVITVGTMPADRLHFAKQQLARTPDADPQTMFMNVGRESYSAIHYALGWSFVYYLTNLEGGRYRAPFGRFLREMNGSGAKPLGEVFRAATRADLGELSKGWRAFVMSLDAGPEPKWVMLAVESAPAGVDVRADDIVVRVDGVDILATDQFNALWADLQAQAKEVDLVLRRRTGEKGAMDYDQAEVRLRVRAGPELQLRGGSTTPRDGSLID